MFSKDITKKAMVCMLFCFLILLTLLISLRHIGFLNFNQYLIFAIIIQLFLVLLSLNAWLVTLGINGNNIYTKKNLIAACLYNTGKYIPGKVWGIVLRTYIVLQEKDNKIKLEDTFNDQVAMLHSGLVLALCATAYIFYGLYVFFVCLIISWASIQFFNKILSVLFNLIGKSFLKENLFFKRIPRNLYAYEKTFYKFCLVWLLLSLTIFLCLKSVDQTMTLSPERTVFITCVCYFSGFIVFFVPSGIGARDGSLYFLLNQSIENTAIATAVTILHRSVSLIVDLIVALPILPIYMTKK